jgi:hypothetical protein
MSSFRARTSFLALASLAALALPGCEAEDLDLASEASDQQAFATTSTSDTQVDESFGGGDGIKRAYSAITQMTPHAVAVTTDHKIVFNMNMGEGSYLVGRVLANGEEDPTWVNGNPSFIRVQDAELGGIVVMGGWTYISGAYEHKAFLARLDNHGTVDVDFGSMQGLYLYDTPWRFDQSGFHTLTKTSDGHIVAGGYGRIGDKQYMLVARFEANGAPDTGFGTNGFSRVPIGTIGATEMGGWVAVGKGREDVYACLTQVRGIFHFDADGKRDTDYDGSVSTGCEGLAATSSGVVYVAGWEWDWVDGVRKQLGGLVTALHANGKPIIGFKGARSPLSSIPLPGTVYVASGYYAFYPTSLEYSEDMERIYVLGRGATPDHSETRTVVAALRPDGQRDKSFAGDGMSMANVPSSQVDWLTDSIMDGERMVGVVGLTNRTSDSPKGVGLIRWAIDAGAEGEPCQSRHYCPGTPVCTNEHPESIYERTCRIPAEPTPPTPPTPPSTPPSTTTVCAGDEITDGYVLTDDSHSGSRCGNPTNPRTFNVWNLTRYEGRPSGSTMSVCSMGDVPAGWAIVSYDWSASRCGHYESRTNNVMTIQRL